MPKPEGIKPDAREPRCFGCGSPERRRSVVRASEYVRDARGADESLADGERLVEVGLPDDFSFCRSCQAVIPDHERLGREARLRAERGR